jgi:hypothetical protein
MRSRVGDSCVGELDAESGELLADRLARFVREVWCPREQSLVIAAAITGLSEAGEDPKPDLTSSRAEAQPCAPSDVVQPGLKRRLEQPPGRFGRLDIPVSCPASVLRQFVLVQPKKRVRDSRSDIGDIDPCNQAAALAVSARCEDRVP